jgi:hypothetical protein
LKINDDACDYVGGAMVVAAMDDDDVHDRGNVSTNESLLNFRMFFFSKKNQKMQKLQFSFQVNIFSCFYFSTFV